jgi:hypothetical protein
MAYDKEQWRAQVQNGKISPGKLAEIHPTQYDPDLQGPGILHPEAASAMSALLQDAHADGVTELKVKFSYRTLEKQWEKWRDYQAGGNLAAYPGTSNHGWAVACDMIGLTARALSWLRNNARKYGFVNDVPTENWHYTYQGGWVPREDDDDMNLEKYVDGEQKYRDRYKEKDRDPGPPPEDRDKWFKAGWNSARFGASNPHGG